MSRSGGAGSLRRMKLGCALAFVVGCGSPEPAPPSGAFTFTPAACASGRWDGAHSDLRPVAGSRFGSIAVHPIPTHFPDAFGGDNGPGLPPDQLAWEHYSNALTDVAAGDAQVESFVALMETATNHGVAILADPSDLEIGSSRTQILVNLRLGASLATVFLPPGWDPSRRVPILFSGEPSGGGNNGRLFGNQIRFTATGPEYGIYAGLSQGGLITVVHNAGGVPSQGTTPDVIDDVGCAIAWIDANLGGDAQRVVFAGKSRGGSTALTWGANPHRLPYATIGIFSHVPIWDGAVLATLPPSMFQINIHGLAEALFTEDAFYESSHPGAMDVLLRALQIITPDGSTASLGTLDARSQLAAIASVPALAVCFATHDGYQLPASNVEMLHDLDAAGARYHAEILIRGPHVDCPATGDKLAAYAQWLAGLASAPPELTGRTFTLSPRIGESGETTSMPGTTTLPRFGYFPVQLEATRRGEVHVCGPPGTAHVVGRFGGATLLDQTQPLANSCARFAFVAPTTAGTIAWTIDDAGIDGAASPVQAGRALATSVVTDKPPYETYFWDAVDERLAGFAQPP